MHWVKVGSKVKPGMQDVQPLSEVHRQFDWQGAQRCPLKYWEDEQVCGEVSGRRRVNSRTGSKVRDCIFIWFIITVA